MAKPLLIGYARCSTDQQDLTAQTEALTTLGVNTKRIYVDHGLTGTNRDRPGLREALAACRAGDTLVVTKLDRLARSLPDARDIVDELTARDIKLNLGGANAFRRTTTKIIDATRLSTRQRPTSSKTLRPNLTQTRRRPNALLSQRHLALAPTDRQVQRC